MSCLIREAAADETTEREIGALIVIDA